MYSLLATLTQLEHLQLSYTCLNLSAESGFHQLKSLTRLRVLSIETCGYSSLSSEDFVWMVQTWRKLERIYVNLPGGTKGKQFRAWLKEVDREDVVIESQQAMMYYWSGLVRMSTRDTPLEFLGGFSALEDLVLVQRHFTSDQLRTILLGCSQTLRSLTMHGISGYGQEAFVNDADQPPLEFTALRELYLKLDRPQSRAFVHLPRICPALEVLHLNVNLEGFDFDLQVMIDHCQKYCPQLHTMHYYERSHQYQRRGYYPEPELYAHLFKYSAPHLRSALLSLPNGLDSHMLDALQSQAATLAHIELRMKRGSTLDTSMLALLLEKTTVLKNLRVDEANFAVEDFDRLCQQPWACQDLKTIIVKGYFTKREQWDRVRPGFDPRVADVIDGMFQDIAVPEEPFVYSDMAHRMYEGDGQGWYLQQGLGEWRYAQAAQERAIKKKLFRHMYSSGLHQVRRVTLNSTDFFAEEKPPAAID